jgi:Rifampin ADP-ribosyl transferase
MMESFFHGTSAEFAAGDEICPDRELGARKGRGSVYVTTDPRVARDYGKYKASAQRVIGNDAARGHAYEVAPTGPVVPDEAVADEYAAFRTSFPVRVIREIEPEAE